MYQFKDLMGLRQHLEKTQAEMADSLALSLRTYASLEAQPLEQLDAKTLKLLERASLDFAVEYGDTSLALPNIAQTAAIFVSRMTRTDARRLRVQRPKKG